MVVSAGEKPACVFVNNNAIKLGADLYASDNSRASIFGALFVGGRAEGGGACYFTNNSTATLQDTTIKRGEATKFAGGGVNIGASANVSMLRCAVVGCITADGGGGIGVFDQARLVLNHSRVANNTALKQTVAGGGVLAQDQATVTLENSQITGNAHPFFMGGGLSFHQQSTLVVSGRVVVANNTADTVGGGIRLASSNFDPDEVLGNIKAYGNKAPFGQDLSVSIQEIKVLNSSNADNFVPSDGADGLLRVTVNVTGHNGVPTDDPLRYIVYNAANITLYTGNIDTAAGMGSVREVLLRLKSPPGEPPSLNTVVQPDSLMSSDGMNLHSRHCCVDGCLVQECTLSCFRLHGPTYMGQHCRPRRCASTLCDVPRVTSLQAGTTRATPAQLASTPSAQLTHSATCAVPISNAQGVQRFGLFLATFNQHRSPLKCTGEFWGWCKGCWCKGCWCKGSTPTSLAGLLPGSCCIFSML